MGRTRHTRKRHIRKKHKRKRTRRRRRTRRRTRRGGFVDNTLQLQVGGGVVMDVTIKGGYKEGITQFSISAGGGKAEHFSISDKAPGDKRGMASDRRKANKFLKAVKRKSRKHKRKRRKRRKR